MNRTFLTLAGSTAAIVLFTMAAIDWALERNAQKSLRAVTEETAVLRREIARTQVPVRPPTASLADKKPLHSIDLYAAVRAAQADDSSAGQLLRSKRTRAEIDFQNRANFTRLGWSEVKIKQWEDALVSFSEKRNDITAAARDQGLAQTDPAIKQLLSGEQADLRSQLTAIVGAEDLAIYNEIDRSQPAQNFVAGLAGRVFGSDLSLTALQGEQLTQIIAETSPVYQTGKRVDLATVDWNSVEIRAQAILSPQQFMVLQREEADLQARGNIQQLEATLVKSAASTP